MVDRCLSFGPFDRWHKISERWFEEIVKLYSEPDVLKACSDVGYDVKNLLEKFGEEHPEINDEKKQHTIELIITSSKPKPTEEYSMFNSVSVYSAQTEEVTTPQGSTFNYESGKFSWQQFDSVRLGQERKATFNDFSTTL